MYAAHLLPPLLLATALAAQSVAPPTLPTLGPIPKGANTLALGADGAVWQGDTKLEGAAIRNAIQPKALFVLAADRAAKCGDVVKLLESARARGATKVVFAARLPDGTDGGFTLALPKAEDATASVELKLHHERAGVPPHSVVPVLARMVRGVEGKVNPFVVGVEAPADEEFEPVLLVLAATAEARAHAALLRCVAAGERPAGVGGGLGALAGQLGGAAAADGAGKGFAIDLGTSPVVRISARATGGTVKVQAMRGEPFGLLAAPEPAPSLVREGGGAGGRYGGRGGSRGKRVGPGTGIADAISNGVGWLQAQLGEEGGIRGPDGKPDVEATALAVLCVLGNGVADADREELLRSGIGLLLDQQRADGSFFDPGLGSVRRTALCAHAMAESYGLLRQGTLLRGSIVDALAWIDAQRQPDGGYTEGNPGGQSDCASTTQCMVAVASAEFFGVKAGATTKDIVPWFDLVAMPDGGHRMTPTPKDAPADPTATGAALFARYFAGQEPRQFGVMSLAADRLVATADPADPWCCYWTTYAMFQTGGRQWAEWIKKVEGSVVKSQTTAGDDAGSWPAAAGLTTAQTTALRVLTLEAFYRYTRMVR